MSERAPRTRLRKRGHESGSSDDERPVQQIVVPLAGVAAPFAEMDAPHYNAPLVAAPMAAALPVGPAVPVPGIGDAVVQAYDGTMLLLIFVVQFTLHY